MKRTLIIQNFLAVSAALLLFCIVSSVVVQNSYYDAERDAVRSLLNMASASLNGGGYAGIVKAIEQGRPGTDAAVIAPGGRTAAGSRNFEGDAAALEDAVKKGYGENIRVDGLGNIRLIAVKKLSGEYFLEISEPLTPLTKYSALILFTAALMAAAFICFLLLAEGAERRIRIPVDAAVSALKLVGEGDYTAPAGEPYFTEFAGEQRLLQSLSEQISEKLKGLSQERDSIVQTLDSMSEGLVVLDAGLRIQLINKSARRFYRAGGDLKGGSLLNLTRAPRTLEAAQNAVLQEKREVFDTPGEQGKILQILISPVRGLATDSGAIMLINDVTAMRRAEQIRSDFVANVSHELKTPLTSIIGFTELLETGIVSEPEKRVRYLALIREEASRMSGLISDILKLSELESVVTDTGKQPVSLKRIAQHVAESIALEARERNVEVTVSGDPGTLAANPDRMTELVLNLADNAVKYNRPGGRVEILIGQGPKSVTLTVADTGVGIPPESQGRVFERFYRVDKGRSRRQGGTGLGLSIVKHIVSLYKGEIDLESEPGRGTTIRVTLPAE